MVVLLSAFSAGCRAPERKPTKQSELDVCRLQKSELESQIRTIERENANLKEQIRILSRVEKDVEIEEIYGLKGIRLTRYTNLYDKDNDGRKETLIVYLQPVDNNGDIVKAAGAVDVQLWDLSKEAEQALLGQWRVERDELKKMWYNSFLVVNYRLNFNAGEKTAQFKDPLTVKVAFTDYITGRVFEEQRVVKP